MLFRCEEKNWSNFTVRFGGDSPQVEMFAKEVEVERRVGVCKSHSGRYSCLVVECAWLSICAIRQVNIIVRQVFGRVQSQLAREEVKEYNRK